MIFADKLISLRKKSGWSQEELAEQMNVTRQSVSKWEGAQSIPDLEKIIKLSQLFGVSTDYLLKDELEEVESIDVAAETSPIKKVSLENAYNFLKLSQSTAKPIAYGVSLCILSPICLLLLGAMSKIPKYGVSENVAGGIGVIILLILIAIAVSIFILNDNKTKDFKYIEKEIFETEYGVTGMIKERKEQYNNTYIKNNIIGVAICILSSVPILIGAIFSKKNDFFLICMTCITLGMIAAGVNILVRNGIIQESFEKLLQESDYSKLEKQSLKIKEIVSTIYWLSILAIYLGYSFITNDWSEKSGIIRPVAAVLFPAILTITNLFTNKNS